MVAVVPVDDRVFVIGQDVFDVAEYDLGEWNGNMPNDTESVEHYGEGAPAALVVLNEAKRDGMTWQVWWL